MYIGITLFIFILYVIFIYNISYLTLQWIPILRKECSVIGQTIKVCVDKIVLLKFHLGVL